MCRARETAAPIEVALGLMAEVIHDAREWELDDPNQVYDTLEDMAPDDPRALAVAEGRYDDFVPELDTAAFQRRIVTAIEDVFMRYQHHSRVVVCTHGGFISAYLAYVIGASGDVVQRRIHRGLAGGSASERTGRSPVGQRDRRLRTPTCRLRLNARSNLTRWPVTGHRRSAARVIWFGSRFRDVDGSRLATCPLRQGTSRPLYRPNDGGH